MQKALLVLAVAACVCAVSVASQMAHRLKGSLRGTSGAAIADAAIRSDNIYGFRGEALAAAIDDLRAMMRVQ